MTHPDRTTPPRYSSLESLILPEGETKMADRGVLIHEFSGGTDDLVWLTFVWPGGKVEAGGDQRLSLALRLINEGSALMSAAEVADFFDFSGTSVSFLPNEHFSAISITTLESKIREVLHVLAGCIASPEMPEAIVDLYRRRDAQNIIISGKRVATQAEWAAASMIMGGSNPLAIPPSPEKIMAYTRDELRETAMDFCATTAGMRIYTAGKITPAVHEGIDEFIGIIGAADTRTSPRSIIPAPFHPCPPSTQRIEMEDSLQSAINMNIPSISRINPDYTDLRLAVIALGGYFGSRLMTNIREAKGYTYGIAAGMLGQMDGSFVTIRSQQDKSYTEAVVEETLKEIVRLRETLMDDDELERLKSYAMSDLAMALDTPFDIAFYRMLELRTGMPHDYFGRMQNSILTATPDTIREMAQRYLNPEAFRTAIAE